MITIISGTNRRGAFSFQLANVTAAYLRSAEVECQVLNLAELPADIFSPDAYDEPPTSFVSWQIAIHNSTGIVWVTPEYNGGVPGVLKLFIDMLDFPSSLKGTPCCLVGVAAGYFGGLRPVEQLSSLLQYRSANIFGERLFVPNCEDEELNSMGFEDLSLQTRFEAMLDGFIAFCNAPKVRPKEIMFD